MDQTDASEDLVPAPAQDPEHVPGFFLGSRLAQNAVFHLDDRIGAEDQTSCVPGSDSARFGPRGAHDEGGCRFARFSLRLGNGARIDQEPYAERGKELAPAR